MTGKSLKPKTVGTSSLLVASLIASNAVQLAAPRIAPAQDEVDALFNEEDYGDPFGDMQPPPPPPPSTQDSGSAPDFQNGGAGAQPSGPGSGYGGFDSNPPQPSYDQNFGREPVQSSSRQLRPSGPLVGGGTATGSPNPVAKPAPGAPSLADAQIEDITDQNYPDLVEANFPNAEITDVVKAISQLTNKNFIIDPGVRGKITIIAPSKVTVAEAYKAFLAALAVNGFTVVPYGKFLKVKASRAAQRDSIETYTGAYAPASDIYITRIIHLKHTSAEEVNKRLRVLPSKDGDVIPYEPTNSLIITDYGANVERISRIVAELDRPGFEEQLEVVKIRYAKSRDLAELINQIINKDPRSGSGGTPTFGTPAPRFRSRGANTGAPEELSLVAPDERTNALIVVGNTAGIAKVKELVRKLDYRLDPAEAGGVFVYYVRYGEAEKIAQTLNGLASQTGTPGGGAGGAPAAGGAPGGFGGGGFGGSFGGGARAASPADRQVIFGGDVRINPDKNTNSLVITASKQDYEVVRSLLAKLDIPRDQVFVEAIIMEMNTNKTREWNPAYYYFDPGSGGAGRAGFSRGNLESLISPAGDKGAILGFGDGAKFKLQIGQTSFEIPSLLSFIRVLQDNVEANILSTPRILALDNEEAMIEVGDKVPIGQNSNVIAGGASLVNNIERADATIKLTLTPFIRPDSDVVRLKIDQSVKGINNAITLAPQIQQIASALSDRTIKTNIVVNSGDTAVLGGLIKDEESVQETKIPILGDIPVLGWLFKSRKVDKKKLNLVVFITPKIIRSVKDGHKLLSEKVNERIDWIKRNMDGRDAFGAKVDKLPKTTKTDNYERVEKTNSDEPVNLRRE